jgi:hypothetical protein
LKYEKARKYKSKKVRRREGKKIGNSQNLRPLVASGVAEGG